MQTLAQFRSKLLPPTHPTSRFISGVAQKIIQASELPRQPDGSIDHFSNPSPELGDWASPGSSISSNPGPVSDWKIHVIDEPKIQNAWVISISENVSFFFYFFTMFEFVYRFVIPGGKIFVFTGILPICQNEAGLATVLGHEVAHQVLRHPAERMSSMKVIFLLTTMLSIVGLDPGTCRAVVTLLMTLPNSRRSEVEGEAFRLLCHWTS
jgi:predicted Zn-dependent protease